MKNLKDMLQDEIKRVEKILHEHSIQPSNVFAHGLIEQELKRAKNAIMVEDDRLMLDSYEFMLTIK